MTENGARHLSDEWLSAHLDADDPGTEDPEHARHLASCESCTARTETLRAAKLLVSTAAVRSPSADSRSRAISAALTAFGDDFPTGTKPGDIDADATTPQSIATSRGRWYRRRPVLVGAAAAVILALAVALPLTLTGKGPGTTSAARAQHRNASGALGATPGAAGVGTSGAAGTSGAGGSGAGNISQVPDLGAVTSKQELISRVRVLETSQGAPGAASSANSPDASGPEGSASGFSPYSVANCVTQTQDETGAHYGPGEVATVTYDGQRAIVMELWKSASAPAAGEEQVAVATQGNCKLLLTTTF